MNAVAGLVFSVLLLAGVQGEHPSYNTPCLQLNGTLTLNITYMINDGKTESYAVEIASGAKAAGVCKNHTATLSLTHTDNSVLELTFVKNEGAEKISSIDSKHWGVTNITYSYKVNKGDARNNTDRSARRDAATFVTPIGDKPATPKLYSCKKEQVSLDEVMLVVNKTSTNATGESVLVSIEGLQIRYSVKNASDTDAYDYHYCKADQKVKDVVPIAVGCALAALVIIVLIAYLIGRRRTVSAGGYERV